VNFASDNVYGASPEVLDAIVAANDGAQPSYGVDAYTKRAEQMFADLFERDVAVYLVTSGTAANAIGLSAITPSYRSVLCHAEAHVLIDECAATEFFTGGSKVVPIHGDDGKITPEGLLAKLSEKGTGPPHFVQPASLSLTQASESGTVYTAAEVSELTMIARDHGLKVHMDGARFANAVAALDCRPADITCGAGIDVLTFGMTKNGALAADVLVFFDMALGNSAPFTRMRSGHLWSKGRYLGAQCCAMLEGDLWLENARYANAMAQKLADGLRRLEGVRLAAPVDANELFPVFPVALHEALREAGAVYGVWPPPGPKGPGTFGEGEVLVRLVTSFATTEEDIEQFLETAAGVASPAL